MQRVKLIVDDYICTTTELAELLGCSSQQVRDLTREGFLYPVKGMKDGRSACYRLSSSIVNYERYIKLKNPAKYVSKAGAEEITIYNGED